MEHVTCPQCNNDVHFQDLQYGQEEEHYSGFRCPHCGGVGIRMSVYKEAEIPYFTYPYFMPFSLAGRLQFVSGECRRDAFTFVSKNGVSRLDQSLVAQIKALPEPDEGPDFVCYFH